MRVRLMRHPVLVLLLLLLLLVPAPGTVHAHAVLLASEPADGQVLATGPGHVLLRFNEPVTAASLRLLGGDGWSEPLVPVVAGASDHVAARLPPLAPGTYVVSGRFLSVDGHPVAQSLIFTIGAADAHAGSSVAARASAGIPGSLRLGHAAGRFLTYAASMAAAGAALFMLLFGRHPAVDVARVRLFARAAALCGVAATLAGALVQSAILLGDDFGPHIDGAAAGRIVGLVLIGIGATRCAIARVFAGAGAPLVVASFALSGHTFAHASAWLSGLLALHLLAAAFWIGSLWPLIRATRCRDVEAVAGLMRRFSLVATAMVPALLVAGFGVTFVLVGDPRAIVDTPYGRALAIKVLLAGGMLGLAAANKWRFVPRLALDPAAAAMLRRSIAVEAALAVLVLGATTALTGLHPPIAGASPQSSPIVSARTASTRVDALILTLTAEPELAGATTFDVEIVSADGRAHDVLGATLTLSRPDLGMEEMSRPLERVAAGRYRYTGPELAFAGPWRIGIELLVDAFAKRTVQFDLSADSVRARHDH